MIISTSILFNLSQPNERSEYQGWVVINNFSPLSIVNKKKYHDID